MIKPIATVVLMLAALGSVGCGVEKHYFGAAGAGTGGSTAPGTGGAIAGGTGGVTPLPVDAQPFETAADASAADATPDQGAVNRPVVPPSGATVSINGMVVPREKAVVFLHLGHSDMAGRAQGPDTERPYFYNTDPHLWKYSRGGVWTQAKEPTAGDGMSTQGAGPGMAILRAALARAPDSYMISIGMGRSGSSQGWCPNFRKGANLFYPQLVGTALELKGKVTFGGLFTMLGITEYHGGDAGLNSFGDCLIGLVNEMRADLGEPNLPLMVGAWNEGGMGDYAPTGQYGVICVPQMKMVPMRDPFAGLIPTDGLPMNDDRHLNMTGHHLWGQRAMMIMADKHWLPWAE